MRLFTYKLTHDSGFAPNPFHDVLTLATCKPGIRRTKMKGDWIAGFSSKALSTNAIKFGVEISPDALIYLAKVSETLEIHRYYLDSRFQCKIPKDSDDPGDNIYKPLSDYPENKGTFEQLDNLGDHGEGDMVHDLSGKNVLVCHEFYYFGRNGVDIPADIKISRPKGPTYYGYKTADPKQIDPLIDWVRAKTKDKKGLNGMPCLMTDNYKSEDNCGGGCGESNIQQKGK